MVLMLVVASSAVVLLLGLASARWWAARALEDVVQDAHEDVGSCLPAGHRPPAGLTPLSPSERFLSQEATRGLRELQDYLAQAA